MAAPQNQEENKLIDILVSAGKVSAEAKQKAYLSFVSNATPMLSWLIDQRIVSEEDIAQAKGKYYNVPFISLRDRAVSPTALKYVEKSMADRLKVVPFDFFPDARELLVAMVNPVDLAAIEFLEKKTGVKVKPFISTPSEVQEIIDVGYEQSLTGEVSAALKEAGTRNMGGVRTVDLKNMGEIVKEGSIAKIISSILEFAVKSRASDVHIEPTEQRTRIRYRIDGILHEKLIMPRDLHDALVSRIKILSDLKIDEKRIPQDGRFNFRADDREVDMRVSTLPTIHGEKVVMRLLQKTAVVPTLPELGLRGRALKNLEEAVTRPHGIILVTGPTGSGKTTTLYSVLSRVNTSKVNIVTLEDPVEYQMPGINQVQVNPQAGLTFASGLRSFLRQDPNIIMVGEVRDKETAALAVQASLTGHLVFSTLHTNNASGALPRLLDMQAEPYLLASTITAIVGQRVARKVCEACKKEIPAKMEVIEDMKKILGRLWPYSDTEEIKLKIGEGCKVCNNSGYIGRIGIFEVLPITEKIGRLILERVPATDIEKEAVEEGMITMKQDGYLKVVEGITSLEEILRVAQE